MKKTPSRKSISNDELAEMVQRGFAETNLEMKKEFAEIRVTMATKKELLQLKDDLEEAMSHHLGTFRKDYDDLAMRVRKLEDKVFSNR